MNTILGVKNLTMDFGGLRALDQVNLYVKKGEIVALIGPNGAGKTTFFNCLTGIFSPTGGDIVVSPPNKMRKRINKFKPNKITELGLARTFQNIRLFQHMTVLENVMIGRHCRMASGIGGAIFRNKATVKEEDRVVDESYNILKTIGLSEYVNDIAMNLPYGAQRRLEIARAMATEPFLLLLDEPAAGMNLKETTELNELILNIRETHQISILLIEHDMRMVMRLSDHIVVMDSGKKIAEGSAEEIKNNPVVIKAYLGEDIDA